MDKDTFLKKFSDLCLRSGLDGFPKDETNLHVILKSAMLLLPRSGSFTEKEINAPLDMWCKDISRVKNMDRASLRRALVDHGYLTRLRDGSSYQIAAPQPKADLFDPAIDEIDLPAAAQSARDEMARRKAEFLAKQGKK